MNIEQAKEQIKNAMLAYFEKDDFGEYVIAEEEQRPIFLVGPPGIGKTAIMRRIASELGVGFISYSMTHHTRQSALGLPFIEKKVYNGKEYAVSEYTMSEIIASIYEQMQRTNITEGILFIDELNCVSETLAPSMLQFLQYKTFGQHKVPDGWIVVTAGNPPEYNNSVREFDIVTMDRLRILEVEADYETWKNYALKESVHPSVISYLDIKKYNFYKIETTVDGKSYVTARGWTDLSTMIKIFEKKNIKIDEILISQYIRNKNIAKDFAGYYELFKKYRSDYEIQSILNGTVDESIIERAQNAKFDERYSLIGLLFEGITEYTKSVYHKKNILIRYRDILNSVSSQIKDSKNDAVKIIKNEINEYSQKLDNTKKTVGISADKQYEMHMIIKKLTDLETHLKYDNSDHIDIIKKDFNSFKTELEEDVKNTSFMLDNIFSFLESAFGDDNEMEIWTVELTVNNYSADFVSNFHSTEYFKHSKTMLLAERHKELKSKILTLDLN